MTSPCRSASCPNSSAAAPRWWRISAPTGSIALAISATANLHYNIFPPEGESRDAYRAEAPAISRALHDLVAELGGSFSAEHGVGRLKVGDLEHYGDPAKLAAMRAIKSALDPRGIMNPGAVLRLPES